MDTMASQVTSLTIVYLTVYSGAYQRKHQSSASLAFARVIHRWPVNSPHKCPTPADIKHNYCGNTTYSNISLSSPWIYKYTTDPHSFITCRPISAGWLLDWASTVPTCQSDIGEWIRNPVDSEVISSKITENNFCKCPLKHCRYTVSNHAAKQSVASVNL